MRVFQPTPEDKGRKNIDRLLIQVGWAVRDQSDANILAQLEKYISDGHKRK